MTAQKQRPTIIGLDIGHSAVKMVVKGTHPFKECFPSFVTKAGAGVKPVNHELNTVEIDGANYYVGEVARQQRNIHIDDTQDGLHERWIESRQYYALAKAAIQKAQMAGNSLDNLFVIHGLAHAHMDSYTDKADAVILNVAPQATTRVLSQPSGAHFRLILDEEGMPAADIDIEEMDTSYIAMIDIGFYTSDFIVQQGTSCINPASGSLGGVYQIVEEVCELINLEINMKPPFDAIMAALESPKPTKTIYLYGKAFDATPFINQAIQSWFENFLNRANNKLEPYAKSLRKVYIAGGGAPLLTPLLKDKKDWPEVVQIEDPRFAISEGYARYGVLTSDVLSEGAE